MSKRTALDVSFVNRVNEALHQADYDVALLDALDQFGSTMTDEILARIASLESKAVSIAGWSTALLGFLLLQRPTSPSVRVLAILTVLATIVALASASEAARARTWKWPTTEHWFCSEHFGNVKHLRAVQSLALLEAYQSASRICARKGFALTMAQGSIAAAGLLAALAVLVGLR